MTSPHITDYEFRKELATKLAKLGEEAAAKAATFRGTAKRNGSPTIAANYDRQARRLEENASLVSLCAGLLLGMAHELKAQEEKMQAPAPAPVPAERDDDEVIIWSRSATRKDSPYPGPYFLAPGCGCGTLEQAAIYTRREAERMVGTRPDSHVIMPAWAKPNYVKGEGVVHD